MLDHGTGTGFSRISLQVMRRVTVGLRVEPDLTGRLLCGLMSEMLKHHCHCKKSPSSQVGIHRSLKFLSWVLYISLPL